MIDTYDSEEQVLALCQQGDKEAFRWLVQEYGALAYRTAMFISSDPGTAEDVVQEAFVLAWRGIDRFKPRGSLRAWLLRIVVNQALSQRRRKVLPTAAIGADRWFGPQDERSVSALEQWELRHVIGQALAGLKENHRLVVVLRYFADLTVPEIARILKWREGTVKSRLHRALGELRPKVDPHLPPPLGERCEQGGVMP